MKTAFFQIIYFPNINAPTGPTDPNVTATNAFAVNTTGGTLLPNPLSAGLLGITVPLPDVGQMSTEIGFDKASSEFIVQKDGYD